MTKAHVKYTSCSCKLNMQVKYANIIILELNCFKTFSECSNSLARTTDFWAYDVEAIGDCHFMPMMSPLLICI